MKLSEWASVSEIVASIVIIASLGYVALELNQNTQALQQTSYQDALDTLSTGDFLLASDAEVHRIVKLGEVDSTEITDTEWSRFEHFAYPRMGVWEHTFLAHSENSISEIQWTALEPFFIDMFCKAGYQRFLKENRVAWSLDFLSYIDSEATPKCSLLQSKI